MSEKNEDLVMLSGNDRIAQTEQNTFPENESEYSILLPQSNEQIYEFWERDSDGSLTALTNVEILSESGERFRSRFPNRPFKVLEFDQTAFDLLRNEFVLANAGGIFLLRHSFFHKGVRSQPSSWRIVFAAQSAFPVGRQFISIWNEQFELSPVRFAGIRGVGIENERTRGRKNEDGSSSWRYWGDSLVNILLIP